MEKLKLMIENYKPVNEQEEADKNLRNYIGGGRNFRPLFYRIAGK